MEGGRTMQVKLNHILPIQFCLCFHTYSIAPDKINSRPCMHALSESATIYARTTFLWWISHLQYHYLQTKFGWNAKMKLLH